MEKVHFTDYQRPEEKSENEMLETSRAFYELMKTRRTIRSFSSKPVPKEVIENCIRAAGTAPNGANKQPWFFGVIQDPEMKRKVREAAEVEENLFYSKRASKSWLNDLKPFGTNAHKPYLEKASCLIPIFYKTHDVVGEEKAKTYYAKESVGLAAGMLITALHNCGLATLTHTPSPMDFLNEVMDLPKSQYKPFILLVTGYPEEGVKVPDITKKELHEISRFY
ncbi:MAG: nitroreductase family protein [Bdellovibrionales bacterium]|nr:nitroreductase family protein [Bdellovibrionales bacterium]NQZ17933.1 nitroreductase family protein [Bdellovibrionales bacterium]